MWKGPGTWAQFSKSFKRFQKNIDLAYIYQLNKFAGLMSCSSRDMLKNAPVSCSNTHHDVIDLVNQGMVKNTKSWISRERNITFLYKTKNVLTCAHFEKLSFCSKRNLEWSCEFGQSSGKTAIATTISFTSCYCWFPKRINPDSDKCNLVVKKKT